MCVQVYTAPRFMSAFPISLESNYPGFLLSSGTEGEHLVKGNGSYRDSSLSPVNGGRSQ